MLGASRLLAVNQSSGGSDLLLNSIAAAVIDGTSLFGGRGTVWAAPLGALVIGSISNGMDLLGLASSVKFMITGAVLPLAVTIDALSWRGRESAGRSGAAGRPRSGTLAAMETAEHIAALRAAGQRLAEAAAGCDLDAPVPTCPDWRLRDLVRHVGTIHRWATTFVNGTRRERYDPFAEMAEADWPSDATLVDWFRAGHAGLVQALEAAPPDLEAPTFLPAPSPLAFWARRQAHETTIHRVDAESPSGTITPCPPALACDGIDEMLFGFAARRGSRLVADPPQTLHLHARDVSGEWLIEIGPGGPTTRHEHRPADCTVAGPAADLYLLLWNRRAADGLDVEGDAGLLERWRTSVQVRWR